MHASVQVVGRKLVADLLAERSILGQIGRRSRSGIGGGGGKKGRNGNGNGMMNGSMVDDVAVNALWEACRCVASLE